MKPIRTLIVDDEPLARLDFLARLHRHLGQQARHRSALDARGSARKDPHTFVVLVRVQKVALELPTE